MSDLPTRDVLTTAKRLVIKVGSSLVTNEGKGVDAEALGTWCSQLAVLIEQGREVILVTSGAIAEGMKRLGWTTRPHELYELQAAAAVGQMGLAMTYETQMRAHGLQSAQILLTHDDLSDRERYLNARSTMLTLLKMRVVPVINENDTLVTDEIRFGDNDTLSALVANLVDADALFILTDQLGLFTADPRKDASARLLDVCIAGTPELEAMAGGAGTVIGTGGMLTKVLAAKRAASSGTNTVIASGREPRVMERLVAGENIGTLFVCDTPKLTARKQWMADHLQMRGTIVIDDGAVTAVQDEGKSLLPIGMVAVEGEFHRGDVVAITSKQGLEIARGLANYASSEARLIVGLPSGAIESALGFMTAKEMIHRDNLVLA